MRRVALVVGLLALSAGTATAAPPGLVLQRADAPGLRPAPAGAAAARKAFAAGLAPARPPGLRGRVQRSHFVGGTTSVWSIASELPSPSAANRALAVQAAALRRARLRLAKAPVGDPGYVVSGHGAALVLWRRRNAVGEVLLSGKFPRASLRRIATASAGLVDSRMSTTLGESAEQRVFDQKRADGTLPRRAALGLFALAYGPIPGTTLPPGPRALLEDGSPAIRAVFRIWLTLSGVQRAAVLRKLGLRSFHRARKPSSLESPATWGDPLFKEKAGLDKLANVMAGKYKAVMGIGLTFKIVAGDTGTPVKGKNGADALADELAVDADGNYYSEGPYCRIRVTPVGQKTLAGDPVYLREVIAHEVFHCYQDQIQPSWLAQSSPDWLIEGGAEWAALQITNSPWRLAGFVEDYLKKPRKPLFTRDYDASGFFGHVQDVSGNLWKMMPNILTEPTDELRYLAADGKHETFLNSWASSSFDATPLGPDWTMQNPVPVPPGYDNDPGWFTYVYEHITSGATVEADPYTLGRYAIDRAAITIPTLPLLHVQIQGHGRMGNKSMDRVDLADAWFCVSGKCECPEGTEGILPPAPPLGGAITALVLTGGPSGAHGVVTLVSLKNFCKRKPKPPPPPPHGGPTGGGGCSGDCGGSNGDPHLTTFDGLFYDFMGVGEYELARSSRAGFEIQARQQPFPGSIDLTVNTAFAMRVGRDRVVVSKGDPLSVRVNGAGYLPTRKLRALPGGGKIRFVPNPMTKPFLSNADQVEVTWPDGSRARLWGALDWGVCLLVKLAPARRGTTSGLLGSFDGNQFDDFVTRGGRHLERGRILSPDAAGLRLLYRVYGDSWRITQRRSLFDYARGQSTRTFTDRRFPSTVFTRQVISKARRRAAERYCRRVGITNPRIFASCVLDVATTGEAGFATSSGVLQKTAPHLGAKGSSGGKGTPGASKWKRITPVSENSSEPPSLALDGSKVVVAYRSDAKHLEAATFTPSVSTGVSGLRRDPIGSGWTDVTLPFLLPRAGGGLQAIATGDGSPLNGTGFAPRNPDGTFGPFTLASNARGAEVQGAGVLAPDGAPLWPGSVAGDLEVWRGATAPTSATLSASFQPPLSNGIPSIGRDSSGRYWLAWAAIGPVSQPALGGIYLMQFDPTTLAAVGVRAKAPQSDTAGGARLTLACGSICRVVYAVGTKVLSWAPGESAPAVVASAAGGIGPVAASPAGTRLWVAWFDERTGTYQARLGDARGVGGTPVSLGRPAEGERGALEGIVSGNHFVLVASWFGKSWGRYVDVVAPA